MLGGGVPYRCALQTSFEGRIYELQFICGQKYPDEPPIVSFRTKINLPCVNARNGEVCVCGCCVKCGCFVYLSASTSGSARDVADSEGLGAREQNGGNLCERMCGGERCTAYLTSVYVCQQEVLVAIKNVMLVPANRKLAQPADGANF